MHVCYQDIPLDLKPEILAALSRTLLGGSIEGGSREAHEPLIKISKADAWRMRAWTARSLRLIATESGNTSNLDCSRRSTDF